MNKEELTNEIKNKTAEIARLMKKYEGSCDMLSIYIILNDNYSNFYSEENKEGTREINYHTFELLKKDDYEKYADYMKYVEGEVIG